MRDKMLPLILLVVSMSFVMIGCGGGSGSNSPSNPPLSTNQVFQYVADPIQGTTALYRGDNSWNDISITAKVKLSDGLSYVSLARYSTSGGNFHQLILSRTGISIYRAHTGELISTPASAVLATPLVNDHWYTLKLEINGNVFNGYVDGVQRITYTDPTIDADNNHGVAAIMSDDDRTTVGRHSTYDDIVVTRNSDNHVLLNENFESYPVGAWTPSGNWTASTVRGTWTIVEE